MGLRLVTLVPDLRPLKGMVNLSKGWTLTSIEGEEAEGGVRLSASCLLTLAALGRSGRTPGGAIGPRVQDQGGNGGHREGSSASAGVGSGSQAGGGGAGNPCSAA